MIRCGPPVRASPDLVQRDSSERRSSRDVADDLANQPPERSLEHTPSPPLYRRYTGAIHAEAILTPEGRHPGRAFMRLSRHAPPPVRTPSTVRPDWGGRRISDIESPPDGRPADAMGAASHRGDVPTQRGAHRAGRMTAYPGGSARRPRPPARADAARKVDESLSCNPIRAGQPAVRNGVHPL